MKNTNKEQWLIDAENEINNFENSKYGKMSEKEFRGSERGNENVESGHLAKISKLGGKVVGDSHVESGHIDRLHKLVLTTDHQSNAGKSGGTKTGSKLWDCPHCGKQGKGPAMTRWHMSNCRHK